VRRVYYLLDADRRPIEVESVEEWDRAISTNRPVAVTEITKGVVVSTVFLGVDRRNHFLKEGPPLLFETMIFGGQLDMRLWYYASWDDAETGHKMAVSKARKSAATKSVCGND
jgi:hypothetical protein